MKKIISVILILMLAFSAAACSDDTKDAGKTEGTNAPEKSSVNKNVDEEDSITKDEENTEAPDSDDDNNESTAGYDAYTEELLATGYISNVKDHGNGTWTLTVTKKWNKMSQDEKEDFANDIFSELCDKADEQYGVLATVKMVDGSGAKVAVSSKDGGGMKIYE